MAAKRWIWTDERMERVVELREKHGMTWDAIGARFGVAGSLACTRYHSYKSRLRIAEKRKEMGLVGPPSQPSKRKPKVPQPLPLVAVPHPEKRPRYFSDVESDIRARIARQGLTAGFCGDPPPGRSALDQREAQK